MNYFNDVKNLNELKAAYRKYAFKLHPDRGGDAKKFSAMQIEYEKMFAWLKTHQQNEAESRTDEQNGEAYTNGNEANQNDVDDGFKDIIEILIHLDGIIIEQCGGWLWLSGETRKHKDALKAAGCYWSAKKKMWYWRSADYHCRHNRHSHSMAYIRAKYGSTRIVADENEKITA